MFTLWSQLNSNFIDEKILNEKLKSTKPQLLETLSYYKPCRKTIGEYLVKQANLKQNEIEFLKRVCEFLNLDEEIVYDLYKSYLETSLNVLRVPNDVLEKIHWNELLNIHFQRFIDYYYRERHCLFENINFILSNLIDKSPKFQNSLERLLSNDELKELLNGLLKDYTCLVKEVKLSTSSTKTFDFNVSEGLYLRSSVQNVKELSLLLESVLLLTFAIQPHVTNDVFIDLLKHFTTNGLMKYLSTNTKIQTQHNLLQKISYLHSLIFLKTCKLNEIVFDKTDITMDEKVELLGNDVKTTVAHFIESFATSNNASSVILCWTTLLYNLKLDDSLSKIIQPDTQTFINRMFALAIKEDVFQYLLNIFNLNIFSNKHTIEFCVKNLLYDFLSAILHSFDDISLGDSKNFDYIYEICFNCLSKNEALCERFWYECKSEERDNITILLANLLEIFPLSIQKTLRLFGVLAQANVKLCEEVVKYLSNMDQYSEYFDAILPQTYAAVNDTIKLTRRRLLFDFYELPVGYKGVLSIQNTNKIFSLTSSTSALSQSSVVTWSFSYNCFTLIKVYFQKLLGLIEQDNLKDSYLQIQYSIVNLIASIMQHFFHMDDNSVYIKHIEDLVKFTFQLFTNIVSRPEQTQYTQMLTRLFELFTVLPSDVYDKVIKLLNENKFILNDTAFDPYTLNDLINDRFNLIDKTKQIYLFKTQNYELVVNYLNLVNSLIKQNGNSNSYVPVVYSALYFIFPQVYKWNVNDFKSSIGLTQSCVQLFHTVLNTKMQKMNRIANVAKQNNMVQLDKMCEIILTNTECSESLLNLVRVSFEFSQDLNFLSEHKTLTEIQTQSLSLINRLIQTSNKQITQTQLFNHLVKSINEPKKSYPTTDLDLFSAFSSLGANILTPLNQQYYQDDINSLNSNWFFNLIKISLYSKSSTSSSIYDCLLFQLLKKLAQLLPRLFTSLFSNDTQTKQFHSMLHAKLKLTSSSQLINSICEFLCAVIDYQPSFFQLLAQLDVQVNQHSEYSFTEGDISIFKNLFDLLECKIDKVATRNHHIIVSSVYSCFYSLWLNKKYDYINYCKKKKNFWQNLLTTLQLMKKEYDRDVVEGDGIGASVSFEQQDNDELYESNVKCVSYVFKILSIELFDNTVLNNYSTDFRTILTEHLFDQNLLERWLEIHNQLLKKDLFDKSIREYDHIDDDDDGQDDDELDYVEKQKLQQTTTAAKPDTVDGFDVTTINLQSKNLYQSLKMLLLILNKSNVHFDLSIKRLNLNKIFQNLLQSIQQIINYLITETYSQQNIYFQFKNQALIKYLYSLCSTVLVLCKSVNSNQLSGFNLNEVFQYFVEILECLVIEDICFMPSIVCSIEACILHLFTIVNTKSAQFDVIRKDKELLHRFTASLTKVFSISSSVLSVTKNTADNVKIFTTNLSLLHVYMNMIDRDLWINELNEACILQYLYSLFQKLLQHNDNSSIVFSIMEIFYTYSLHEPEILANSDFTSNTCLIIGKLFEYSFTHNEHEVVTLRQQQLRQQLAQQQLYDRKRMIKTETQKLWCDTLRLYINIQTLLLSRLKYNFLSDSILFIGSYYEVMVQIIQELLHSCDYDLLQTIITICRYISEISKYKKELLIQVSQTFDNIPRIFSSLLQICISRLCRFRFLDMSIKKTFDLEKSTTGGKIEELNVTNDSTDDLVIAQNLFLQLICNCLNTLRNYIPNLCDFKYDTHLSEYKLLLSIHFTPPSFDSQSPLSFGCILWLIDYCLKVLHKYEIMAVKSSTTPTKRVQDIIEQNTQNAQSPKRSHSVTEDYKLPTKSLVIYVLENLLYFLLTQTILCVRHSDYSIRDKKLFKRELNSEISSILQGVNRNYKRQTAAAQSPSATSTSLLQTTTASLLATSGSAFSFAGVSKQTDEFFKSIENILNQTLQ